MMIIALIRDANAVHGDKYRYDKVPDRRLVNQEKITVICPVHGEWEVSRGNHINHRSGCPNCFKKKRNRKSLDMI